MATFGYMLRLSFPKSWWTLWTKALTWCLQPFNGFMKRKSHCSLLMDLFKLGEIWCQGEFLLLMYVNAFSFCTCSLNSSCCPNKNLLSYTIPFYCWHIELAISSLLEETAALAFFFFFFFIVLLHLLPMCACLKNNCSWEELNEICWLPFSSLQKKYGKIKTSQRFQRFQESDYMDPNQVLCLGALFDIAATNVCCYLTLYLSNSCYYLGKTFYIH